MKRTIEEIVTIYDLEPETRKDVFVEGVTDREHLGFYLADRGFRSRSVYAIETVEVPNDVVLRFGLNTGSNRSRVLALAYTLWEQIGADCTLMFIIDKDVGDFVGDPNVRDGIYRTDFTSMEGYLLTNQAIGDFLAAVCSRPRDEREAVIEDLKTSMIKVFAVRVALARLGLCARIINPARFVESAGGRAYFNVDELIRRTLAAANELRQLDAVRTATADVENELQGLHVGACCHGHDAMAILGEFGFVNSRDSAYRREGVVRRTLRMSVPNSVLDDYPLYKALRA